MSGWVAPYFSLVSTNNWLKPSNESHQREFGELCARQRCSTCPGEHSICCSGLVCIRLFRLVLFCVDACMYPCFVLFPCFALFSILFRIVWLVCDLLSRMGVYSVISWKVGPHRSGALWRWTWYRLWGRPSRFAVLVWSEQQRKWFLMHNCVILSSAPSVQTQKHSWAMTLSCVKLRS